MANITERIRTKILEIGRGANEQLDFIFRGNNILTNPGFRRSASSDELTLRSGGRTDFRRLEALPTSISSDTVLSTSDHNKLLLVNTSAARLITLPTPAAGLVFHLKDVTGSAATNNITVARAGSEKIDNVTASLVIKQPYAARTLISNGTDWFSMNFDPAWLSSMPNSIGFASGVGCDFSALTNPGGQTIASKLLASYMEGSFTAGITVAAGTLTLNASVRTVTWVKIGKVVFLSGRLDIATQSATSGIVKLTGLPYAAAVDCAIQIGYVVGRSFNSQAQNLYGKVLTGTSDIVIEDFQDGDAANGGNRMFSGGTFVLGGHYIAST